MVFPGGNNLQKSKFFRKNHFAEKLWFFLDLHILFVLQYKIYIIKASSINDVTEKDDF